MSPHRKASFPALTSIQVVRWTGAHPPSEQEAEARLHQEGYSVFKWHDVPGAEYPEHHHHCDECLWILAGSITVSFEGQSHTLNPGDRLLLPKDVDHKAIVPADPSGVTYLVGQRS